jgi:hypothetical protein
MLLNAPPLPPRVGLRVGERVLPATPVLLRGQEASLVVPLVPEGRDDVRVVLDWEGGAVTELQVALRAVDGDGRIAHVDVCGVEGDWQPFLHWLGHQGV